MRLCVALLFLTFTLKPCIVWGWDKDKAWLERQLKGTSNEITLDPNSYIGKAVKNAKARWDSDNDGTPDPGAAALTSHGDPDERKYWAGELDPSAVLDWVKNWAEDMKVNFFEDFDGCVEADFDVDWFPFEVTFSLYWPEYQVHTHPIFQNRYGDLMEMLKAVADVIAGLFGVNLLPTALDIPQPYPALYALDAHALPVPGLQDYSYQRHILQPNMMGHAMFNVENDLVTKLAPLIAALEASGMDSSWLRPNLALYTLPRVSPAFRYNPLNPYNFQFYSAASSSVMEDLDLLRHDKEVRYGSVPSSSNRHTLEFSILPTMFSFIWRMIPMIALLPSKCRPSPKVIFPWDSDRMNMYFQTRDPFLELAQYTRDGKFRDDYKRWLINPKVCTEYNMVKHAAYPNIPYDQFDTTIRLPFLPDIDLPDLLTPIPNNKAGDLSRMCTHKGGANVPFTIYNNPQGSEVVSALQNVEKAGRLSYAYYLQYIQRNPDLANFFKFDPINKAENKVQFTSHDAVSHKCMRFGTMGELFDGSNAMVKKGEYGLYSATVWKRYQCDIGLPRAVLLLVLLPTLWMTIIPLLVAFGL